MTLTKSELSELLAQAESFSRQTLGEIKSRVQQSGVDTDLATSAAAQIEGDSMFTWSREQKIAVFLAGLMANLIEHPAERRRQ